MDDCMAQRCTRLIYHQPHVQPRSFVLSLDYYQLLLRLRKSYLLVILLLNDDGVFFCIFAATSLSIWPVHLLANSSSVNRLADLRALCLTAKGLGSDSAFSKPSANSEAVVAWKPVNPYQ